MRRAGRRAALLFAGLLLASLAVVGGPAGAASGAGQDPVFTPVPETGERGHLQLASSPYPLTFPSLRPGQQYSWQLRLRVAEGDPAATSLKLSATGALAVTGGYLVTVRECSEPWNGASGVGAELRCPGRPMLRVDREALKTVDPQTSVPLAGLPRGRDSYLAVTLEAPRGTPAAPRGGLRLGLGITAQSEDDAGPTPPGGGHLGDTGFEGGRFALLGGGTLLAGAALWAAFRRGPAAVTPREGPDEEKDGGAS
ncbi:hypothetical protein [Arthrobacter woluwensis]|uniref:Uncharacterized protein n=1 Tax=Arthrobacter woluwensis TaxID=156980 RepID=A0A1H4W1X6_9MICC|nr:hypothetical protein [Arthrobacter woluwensis]SEC87233.1 hypothetical protein SAMN04489745_3388 [Arthrobacter woluwensis]